MRELEVASKFHKFKCTVVLESIGTSPLHDEICNVPKFTSTRSLGMDSIKSKNLDFKSSLANNKLCCAFALNARTLRAIAKLNICLTKDTTLAWKNDDWECVVIFSRRHEHLYPILTSVFKNYMENIPVSSTWAYFMIACKSGLRSQVPVEKTITAPKVGSSKINTSFSNETRSRIVDKYQYDAHTKKRAVDVANSLSPVVTQSSAFQSLPERNAFSVKKSRNQIADLSPENIKSATDAAPVHSSRVKSCVEPAVNKSPSISAPDLTRNASSSKALNGGSGKIIEQRDASTNIVVGTYTSQIEAFKRTGIPPSAINECCLGIISSTRGFTFRFRDISGGQSDKMEASVPSVGEEASSTTNDSNEPLDRTNDIRSGPLPYDKGQSLPNRQSSEDALTTTLIAASDTAVNRTVALSVSSTSVQSRPYKPSKTTGRFTGKDIDLGSIIKPIRPPVITSSYVHSSSTALTPNQQSSSNLGVSQAVKPSSGSVSELSLPSTSHRPNSTTVTTTKESNIDKFRQVGPSIVSASTLDAPKMLDTSTPLSSDRDGNIDKTKAVAAPAPSSSRFEELKQLLSAKSGTLSTPSSVTNEERAAILQDARSREFPTFVESAIGAGSRLLVSSRADRVVDSTHHRPSFSFSDDEEDEETGVISTQKKSEGGFDIDALLHSVVDSIAADKERSEAQSKGGFRALKRHRPDNEAKNDQSAVTVTAQPTPPVVVCAPDEFDENDLTSSSDESALPVAKKKRNRGERRQLMRANGWKSHQRRDDVMAARQFNNDAEHKIDTNATSS